jgi:hypothetical protein
MKGPIWADQLRTAAASMSVQPAGLDTTREGMFREHLEDFLTDRSRGREREDILSGRPWEDEDKQRYEFRVRDVHAFLTREGMRDATRHECEQWIKNLGGGRVSESPTTIKGKGVRLWFVPSSVVKCSPPVSDPNYVQGFDEM